MDVTTAAFLVVVVVFGYDLPLSCAKFELIYHTSLDSVCAAQVKLSFARFNQIVIILRHNLVN